MTRDEPYREWTCRVADYFVATSSRTAAGTIVGRMATPHVTIMVTAEFVMILDTMIGCLSVA